MQINIVILERKEQYYEYIEGFLYGPGIADELVSHRNHNFSVSKNFK